MPLEGCQLNRKEALAVCRAAGFHGDGLILACAVMSAESARYTRAYYDNGDSIDRGLFQINSKWHPDLDDDEAYNPWLNVRYAYEMSNHGANWTPWAAYNNGHYEVNVEKFQTALAAAKAGKWTKPLDFRVAEIRAAREDWDPCKTRTVVRAARVR